MAVNRAHRLTRIDYWPGFVDAMATLLLVFVFLLSVFILAQFFLGQEVTSKDTVLTRLNAQIAELTDLLAMEKSGSRDLQDTIATLQANLAASESDRNRLQGLVDFDRQRGRRSGRPHRLAARRPEVPAAGQPERVGAGRVAQSADRRTSPPACRA